jgi:GTP:adenosylcobinamide-phosphate guanylyltransferase
MLMYAIVTAGGIPGPNDPLYPETQGHSKALLDIAGKPMIQWVLDALGKVQRIEGVIIIGLEEGSPVTCEHPLFFMPNQGSMLANVVNGIKEMARRSPDARYALIVSSDIPAIQPHMVDWVITTSLETDDDLYYNVITREVMEKRFPTSKRTYTHLKGIELCGGDMSMVSVRALQSDMNFWDQLIASRKNPLQQAFLFGIDLLFLVLLRQITIEETVVRVSRKVNLKGRALRCPYAEVGMDVDKPHQLAIMRADLASQRNT